MTITVPDSVATAWGLLQDLNGGYWEYDSIKKHQYSVAAKLVCQWLQDSILGGAPGRISYNPGGPAVSGETTLHTDRVYVQLCADCLDGVLVRACSGLNDCVGGANTYVPLKHTARKLAEHVKDTYERGCKHGS